LPYQAVAGHAQGVKPLPAAAQGVLRKDRVAKACFHQPLDGLGVVCLHRHPWTDVQLGKEAVDRSAAEFAAALRHEPCNPRFNSDFRQLLHVAYRVPASMGRRSLNMLEEYAEPIARNVTQNLFERHIRPVFLGLSPGGEPRIDVPSKLASAGPPIPSLMNRE
jgi:hypothetical protein